MCKFLNWPETWQPGFDFHRQLRSLPNRFHAEQGHCSACRRKSRLTDDTDLCPCGETQTMSHIVESCPLTKLNGGLSRLHSADEDAVLWQTSYGSWRAYEKKIEAGLLQLPFDGLQQATHGRAVIGTQLYKSWTIFGRMTYCAAAWKLL